MRIADLSPRAKEKLRVLLRMKLLDTFKRNVERYVDELFKKIEDVRLLPFETVTLTIHFDFEGGDLIRVIEELSKEG